MDTKKISKIPMQGKTYHETNIMYILKLEFSELTSLYAKQHFWLISDNSALLIIFCFP